MEIFKIAGIQFRATEDLRRNIEKGKELLALAHKEGVKVVSFAELFHLPWFPHTREADPAPLSETIPGPIVEEFSPLAKKMDAVVVLPILEVERGRVKNGDSNKSGGRYYNAAAVIDADGKYLGKYRKVHIPQLPLWFEKDYFTPGGGKGSKDPFPVFQTKYLKLGVQICWDNFFPEGSRALGLKGSELIVAPTAAAMKTHERWEKVISANAITNGLFAMRVNRTGSETAQDFYGESFCVDPNGEMIGEPSGMNDGVSIFEINLKMIKEVREMWPFFKDRRPELYGQRSCPSLKLGIKKKFGAKL
ncbi:MAG: acyltransferase [Deltaproteobacteria bacterium]|uniref:Acyltransferase n=1 Tax=Candidatus Zymogenus saltonus TaxID=2844893 RepID=A0A9D8KHK5_9DELT|nr:acyltransferase [Candidatus Zymogenus saltonus]